MDQHGEEGIKILNSSLKHYIDTQVRQALEEDIGSGDISADLIPPQIQAKASILCRDHAVLCGTAWVDACFRLVDPAVSLSWFHGDGDTLSPQTVLCTMAGPARSILTAERTALNFLQTLMGTATTTKRFVDRLTGHSTRLLDTRKTLPGWRQALKYATRTAGATNHRFGLYDAYLIKENHIIACGGIKEAVSRANALHPDKTVEVEVENLTELNQALEAGADIVLLDNFSIAELRQAVDLNQGKATLEASGGITLDNLAEVAATGVDAISVGSITKHITAVDLSLRFETQSPRDV